MQSVTILAALERAAAGPALGGIYIRAVRVAAVHDWTHDPILTITWSMPDGSAYIAAPDLSGPGVTASVISRPADTAMRLARHLASPDELDQALLQVAWCTGAWDVSRLEHARLPAGASWDEPRYGLASDFGHNPYTIGGQPLTIGESADDKTCDLAATSGWVTWAFMPMALATPAARQQHQAKDKTLTTVGRRLGDVPMTPAKWWHPADVGTAHQHIYELGKVTTGAAPDAARPRRASYAARLARRAIQRAGEKK